MDDQTIIRCIQNGEVEVFADLVRKYHRNLLAFIFRLVGDAGLAEDIGQEVFLKVYQELPRFEVARGVPFAAWLYIIARNQAISELRKRTRNRTLPEEHFQHLPAPGKSPEETLINRETLAALAATVANLPEPFRATILMSLQGASLEEIADRCGIAPATVKTRLFRAREKIKMLMKVHFGGVGYEKRI